MTQRKIRNILWHTRQHKFAAAAVPELTSQLNALDDCLVERITAAGEGSTWTRKSITRVVMEARHLLVNGNGSKRFEDLLDVAIGNYNRRLKGDRG